MAKLTLSVNDRTIGNAKHYAGNHGVSVSELVENYLDAISEPPSGNYPVPPVLQSVLGVLKSGTIEDYREHLATKY